MKTEFMSLLLLLTVLTAIDVSSFPIKTGMNLDQVKRSVSQQVNDYVLTLFNNWKSYKAQNCNVTYNDQPVSPYICRATTVRAFEAYDTDEYDDCYQQFTVNLSAVATNSITSIALVLYRLPLLTSRSYYTIIKYGSKITAKWVPESSTGWLNISLEQALSEIVEGKLNILITVYAGGQFLSCQDTKSLLVITDKNPAGFMGSPEGFVPLLSVRANASNPGMEVQQNVSQNHSYITQVNQTMSECGIRPTDICSSYIILSSRTSNKVDTCEVRFNLMFNRDQQYIGGELALYFNSSGVNESHNVYVYRRISPVQYTSMTKLFIPPNRNGWQRLTLDTLANVMEVGQQQKNITVFIQVERTGVALKFLQCSELQSLFALHSGSPISPIVMTFVRNPCSILCKRSVLAEEHLRGKTNSTDKKTHHCRLQDHVIDLKSVHPHVVYPEMANIGRCVHHGHAALESNETSELAADNRDSDSCMPSAYSPLYSLHSNPQQFYEILQHPNIMVTQCGV